MALVKNTQWKVVAINQVCVNGECLVDDELKKDCDIAKNETAVTRFYINYTTRKRGGCVQHANVTILNLLAYASKLLSKLQKLFKLFLQLN